MSRDTPYQLAEYARIGYYGNPCPHLSSSPAWCAHMLGKYLHDTGRAIPHDVRMGRDKSIRANDMRFTFQVSDDKSIRFERIE